MSIILRLSVREAGGKLDAELLKQRATEINEAYRLSCEIAFRAMKRLRNQDDQNNKPNAHF